MKKILFLSFFVLGCGGEIYYLDSYNYSKSGEPLYETKQLESSEFKEASIEAYEFIANEIRKKYNEPWSNPVFLVSSKKYSR